MAGKVKPINVNDLLGMDGYVARDDSPDTSSLDSSLRSFAIPDLDLDGDGADADSIGASMSTDADATSGTGAEKTQTADGASSSQHSLLDNIVRHCQEDIRSEELDQKLKEKKERLDELYTVVRQSYFDKTNCKGFSFVNECRCIQDSLVRFYLTLEEERLPWLTDFADPKKMRFPHKMKEISLRLNLNIAYYASNYLEIFYAVTLPFLLYYNPIFLALLVACCFLVHDASARKRIDNEYGDCVTLLGRSMSYRRVGHLVIVLVVVAVFFFHGLQTILAICALNGAIVIPHAIWRRPTFFDDEELEKCRPKMIQYFITMAVTILAYLEGNTEGREDCGFRLAQKRRAKLGLRVLKLEDDPYIHS